MRMKDKGTPKRRFGQAITDNVWLAWYAFREAIALGWLPLGLILGVLGLDSAPLFSALRENAERQRRLASRVLDRPLSAPPFTARRVAGIEEVVAQLRDPETLADIRWHLTNPLLSAIGLSVQLACMIAGVVYMVQGAVGFVDYLPYATNYLAGLAFGTVLLISTLPLARVNQLTTARRAAFQLADAPGQTALAKRVDELTTTRRSALELQEAEIRRIERDLHDGAQARIVTMGMTLTQVERLLEIDPEGARLLLATAKSDSSAALQDLRGLVRGIRPPVLADRGLVAAARALAASSPIDMRVEASDSFRLIAPLESALYFTIAELVTNAAKHSGASEIVIDLEDESDWAVARVTDNGIGGVVEGPFGGIAGIRARLAPFDGHLDVISPVGGPTVVTARVPRPV